MLHRLLLYLLIMGLAIIEVKGQDNNRKSITFLPNQTYVIPDSGIILLNSLHVMSHDNELKLGQDYQFETLSGKIIPMHDTVTITKVEWESIPVSMLRKPVSKKSKELIRSSFKETTNPYLYSGASGNTKIIESGGMQLNGNIGRGITGGNTQNLTVNANLNLQVSGKIADLDVKAAISDENNPIQPEGNTQQLQDFDKVYIQLSKGEQQFIIGDFEMRSGVSDYFLKFDKKSRGISFHTSIPLQKHATLITEGQGAISRGRFARNTINAIEGNQGPYKLTGAQGETYIIIISGTEAVYIDGEKLKRGEQNDYIIDYNSGEITFMPRRLITRYNRIVVEFQYADRNYARSVFQLSSNLVSEKYNFHIAYYTEQDHKNQPFLQNLSDSDKNILALAGDRMQEAVTSGVTSVNTFSNTRILYRSVDTLGFKPVYVFTSIKGEDSIFYDVKFSYVGSNKGNYILSSSAANGRTFKWVVPIAGKPQGDYEPVVQLIAARRNQMFIVGGSTNLSKKSKVSIEYAHSSLDKNTFSNQDKTDDGGNGIRFIYQYATPIGGQENDPIQLGTEIKYEQVDAGFRFIERYRDVEFERSWNRLLTNPTAQDTGYNERIVSMKTTLGNLSNGNVFYQLGYYNRNAAFTGLQQTAGTNLNWNKISFRSNAEYLNTNSIGNSEISNETKSIRTDLSYLFPYLRSGIKYETEQSLFKKNNDTLVIGSYGFELVGLYLKNADSSNISYKLEYNRRVDNLPQSEGLRQATIGSNYMGSIDFTQTNMNRFSASFTYRDLVISDTTLISQTAERTLLSRLEYDYGFWKRFISANTYIQLGSGNELKRDFQFLQVIQGQGMYLWKDFNNDGIQTTDEFVTASTADRNRADYIKVFLPTNSSIKVNTNQFNQTLNLTPAVLFKQTSGMKGVLSRIHNQSAIRFERKTNDLSNEVFANPFASINNSNRISQNNLFRNNLFYNRNNPNWGGDYSYLNTQSRNLLSYGTDIRGKEENQFNLRWNVNATTGLMIGYGYGQRYYYSEFYAENNYKFNYFEIKPRLIYQATKQIRITLIYTDFNASTLPIYGNKKGTNKETGIEWRYSMTGAGVLNLKYSNYQVSFDGNLSSTLGYDMLQGYSIGQNQVWNISYQQMFGTNVQFTLNYDGRKSENNESIHIGRMEARYIF